MGGCLLPQSCFCVGYCSAEMQFYAVNLDLLWLQVIDPEPPTVLFPKNAPQFPGPPPGSFAGDVLYSQPHRMVTSPPQELQVPVPECPS